MSQETNPFRLSMLRRSQSPIEDPFEPLSAPPPPIQFPRAGDRSTSASSSNSNNNPFRVDLQDPPAPTVRSVSDQRPDLRSDLRPAAQPEYRPQFRDDGAEAATALDPPPYFESEGRRHSDPNLTRPNDEKSAAPARDDGYREGYEEGMRIARERERQRRREARERRARALGAQGDSDVRRERSTSTEHRSERAASSEHRSSRRARSKSESAGRSRSSRHKQKPSASLDVIDKMDVTGVYGGSGFHHDGPFDACAPHRNSKTSKRNPAIPIAAFPADGPNNSLAVEDPTFAAYRKEESVYGRNVDPPPEVAQASFDPTERGAKVHGQRTMGLGSTTFMDGTPASRDAIEQAGRSQLGRSRSLMRRQPSSEDYDQDEPKSLLSRVRSLRVGRH